MIYRAGNQITIHLRHGWGLTLAPRYIRPSSDSWPHYAYWQACGICVWHDTSPPLTVGQRGAW